MSRSKVSAKLVFMKPANGIENMLDGAFGTPTNSIVAFRRRTRKN